MSIKYYVLGGPRYKPPGVSRGSPRLHFILIYMLIHLFVCLYVVTEIKFNSIQLSLLACLIYRWRLAPASTSYLTTWPSQNSTWRHMTSSHAENGGLIRKYRPRSADSSFDIRPHPYRDVFVDYSPENAHDNRNHAAMMCTSSQSARDAHVRHRRLRPTWHLYFAACYKFVRSPIQCLFGTVSFFG